MPSNASSKQEMTYNQVQYFGCHLIKYKDDAARITRVYPIIFGINRKMLSWFIRGWILGVVDSEILVCDFKESIVLDVPF